MGFNLVQFRKHLRAEREARVGGREKLADLAGVNKSTIQNIETGTDIPGIDTVARLVEAMPGLTLGKFFDTLDINLLQGTNAMKDTAPSHLSVEATSHAHPVSLDVDALTIAELLTAGFETLAQHIDRAAERLASGDRPSPGTGDHTPRRRGGGGQGRQ